MGLDYQQRRELNSKISQSSQNIIQTIVVYSLEAVKFVANFIGNMMKQVLGK
ncbi:MAG: hypothetical protein ABI425_04115 [Patescibacteria group bacterium]